MKTNSEAQKQQDLLTLPTDVQWDATYEVANPQGQGHAKYLFVKQETDSKYFKATMMMHGVSALSGQQTRKVTAVIFADSLMGKAIIADMDAPADAKHDIDLETGKQTTPVWGAFHDIFIGLHKMSWTPTGGTPREDIIDTRSQFIMKGDSAQKEYLRVRKQVAKDPAFEEIKPTVSQGTADQINEQFAAS